MADYLLDTHLLLWSGGNISRLGRAARIVISDETNVVLFSPVNVAEVAIKHAQGRPDFPTDAAGFHRRLVDNGYRELPLRSAHAIALSALPPIHKDPFDRLLIAQAIAEGVTLLTSDATVARYPGPVRLV